MSKHTPEPWTSEEGPAEEFWFGSGYVQIASGLVAGLGTVHGKEDAARALACVNALAGIPDPERFVSAVRAAVAAGSIEELHLTLIRNAMEGKP